MPLVARSPNSREMSPGCGMAVTKPLRCVDDAVTMNVVVARTDFPDDWQDVVTSCDPGDASPGTEKPSPSIVPPASGLTVPTRWPSKNT